MKHFRLTYSIIFILLSAFGFGIRAYAKDIKIPDAETTRRMSNDEIKRLADNLSVLELKQWADSIYFRTDLRTYPRTTAEIIYKQLMQRATGNLSPRDEKIMAAAYSNYATYLIFERNNPVQAYPLLKRSLEIIDKYKDEGLLVIGAFTNLAHIYANFNDTTKAIDHLNKGFAYALSSDSPQRAGYIYAQLLLMAWQFERLPAIRPAMNRFKSEKALRNSLLYEYNLDLTQGVESYMKGDYEDALNRINHARSHVNAEYDPQIYTSMTLLMAADAALRANKNSIASNLIDSAEYHLYGYHEVNGRDFLNSIRARFLRQTGHPDEAYQCEIKSLILRDSLYNARNMTTISDLEQNLITSKFNTELREAQLHQEVLKEKNKRQKTLIILMAAASAIIITLLLFLLYKRRKLNECRYDLIIKEIERRPAHDPQPPTLEIEDDPRLKDIFDAAEKFMSSSDSILSPGFTIDELSSSIGFPVKLVSKAINIHAQKNFSLYLSDYRIREACRILVDADPDNRPTIEWVAEKVGYRSRSHFSRTFKLVTGLTTTDFIRQTRRYRS